MANLVNNIQLNVLSIKNPASGNEINLKDVFEDITIHEDVFSFCISATIVLTVTTPLDEVLPFSGQDVVTIDFASLDDTGKELSSIQTALVAYKMGDTIHENTIKKTYTLYCASPEAIQNEKIKINKQYNQEFSENVKSAFGTLKSPKKLNIPDSSKTNLEDPVIIPNWSPFKTINFFANRSVPNKSDARSASYLFFEKFIGGGGSEFVYASLESLVQTADAKQYVSAVKNAGIVPSEAKSKKDIIDSHVLISNQDYLNDISTGVLSGEVLTVDLTRKRFERHTKNFFKDGKTVRKMETKGEAVADTTEEIPTTSNINVISKHTGMFEPSNMKLVVKGGIIDRSQFKDSSHIEQTGWARSSFMHKIEKTKCIIAAPGDTNVRLGTIANFKLPKANSKDQTTGHDFLKDRWFISAITHNINRYDGYTHKVELVKDSYTDQLPSINFDAIVSQSIKQAIAAASAAANAARRVFGF